MDIATRVKTTILQTLGEVYSALNAGSEIPITETRPEFEGDFTILLFTFAKTFKKAPESLGQEWGDILTKKHPKLFSTFNVIKGFLNLTVADSVWFDFLQAEYNNAQFGIKQQQEGKIMVEYSSPNTNKPLHLGHLRNNFLGWSMGAIYRANGYETIKTCIANDRGIHICKSMVSWQLFGYGTTPSSTGIKGDHFVGNYYVLFGKELQRQTEVLMGEGLGREESEKQAPIMKAAQQMLVDWESGNLDVLALWKRMNNWVYEGFEATYKRIGSDFDKIYYESNTYILGKKLVEYGLENGIFYQIEDGSVWIDLTSDGLDQKIVRRKDGTAVYITQDIGLVVQKYDEFKCDSSIYVVGDEQNYHFKVLKLICQKLNLPSVDGMFHLSYGMVELPGGRMKTREGTVVDADDILDEMKMEAAKKTAELGKTIGFDAQEIDLLHEMIGLGGLKFFLLRVDPKKRILFIPEESIDLHGYTATFIQYAHARIKSIIRKNAIAGAVQDIEQWTFKRSEPLLKMEKLVIVQLEKYPDVLSLACQERNPSLVANYAYNLAKSYNSFYAELSIANAGSDEKNKLRLQISQLTAVILKGAMGLLGIGVPERM